MDWLAPIRWARNLVTRDGPWPIAGERVYVRRPPGSTKINEDSALTLPAVFAAVNRIASDIAGLPWGHFEKSVATDGTSTRRKLETTDIAWLLHTQPNPETNAFIWRQAIVAHMLIWGNGYAQIARDARGRPAWLWLITPDVVTPKREEGELIYRVWGAEGWQTLAAADVLHFKGLGFDGERGYSRVAMAARTFGITLQQDELADHFYGNGAHTPGVIVQKSGRSLTPEARDVLLDTFNQRHAGSRKAGRTAYLDGGMEYLQLKMPMTDAQFLESRRFSVREIAQWFQIPPHKLGDMDRSTWANIEQQAIDYVVDCLAPIVNMMEAEVNMKLLGRNQFGTQYTKLDLRGLMRGDQKQRNDAYAVALQNGWLNRNEVRALEDLDPIGEEGDTYLVQANLTTIERIEEPPEAPAPALPVPTRTAEEQTTDLLHAVVAITGNMQPVLNISPPHVAIGETHITVPVTVPERKADIHVLPPPPNILVEGATIHSPVSIQVPERTVNIENHAPSFHVEPVNVIVPEREVRVETPVNVTVPEREVRIEPAVVNVTTPEVKIDNRVDTSPPIVNVIAPPPETPEPQEQMTIKTFLHDLEGQRTGEITRTVPKRRKKKDG